MVLLGGGAASHERGTPVTVLNRWRREIFSVAKPAFSVHTAVLTPRIQSTVVTLRIKSTFGELVNSCGRVPSVEGKVFRVFHELRPLPRKATLHSKTEHYLILKNTLSQN